MIADKVRLEVAGDAPPGAFVNLVPNPNGDLGGYGWLTPLAGSSIGSTPNRPHELRYVTGIGANSYNTILVPVTPGEWLGWGYIAPYVKGFLRATIDFYDASRTFLSSSSSSPYFGTTLAFTTRPAVQVPASAVLARVRFNQYRSTAGDNPPSAWTSRVKNVLLIQGDTSAAVTSPTYTDATYLVDVTDSVTQLDVTRAELDAGSLAVVLRNTALHPATNPLLRSGRTVRLSAFNGTDWDVVIEGKMSRPTCAVDKRLLNAGNPKAATITFTAEDPTTRLAAYTRTVGVFDQAYIPTMLEAFDVPWNVNGNTQQVASVPAGRSYLAASGTTLLDLITRIRNSYWNYTTGTPYWVHAWVDRYGVLQVWNTNSSTALERNIAPDDAFTDDRGINAWEPVTNATLAYLSDDPTYGYALRATATAAGTTTWRTLAQPVVPGAELLLRFNVRLQTAGRRVTGTAVYFNAAGTEIARTPLATTTGFTTTSYLGYGDRTSIVPAGAVTASLEVLAENLAAGENVYMSRGDAWTAFDVVLGDADLTDAPYGWGDDQNFNTLTIDSIQTGGDGKPEQKTWGPYTDAASVATYGPRPATIPVCGFPAADANLTALKAYLLARNAVPREGVTEVRIPLRNQAEIARHAYRDVCDRVRLTGEVTDTDLRVTSVTNTIRPTNDGGTWLQTLTLAPLDRITS